MDNTEIKTVSLHWPEDCNIIVGQSHFIKTVEDLAEIIASTVPGAKFGIAFCEASGPCLIRTEGTEQELVKSATDCAEAVAAGHTFYIVIRDMYPINILTQIKSCPEVAGIFAATANPLQIVTAVSDQGAGIIGVIDGFSPKGSENAKERAERKDLLRKIGYKFC
ncbi:MAG: adenosine-specific kinase [Spirochaetales bacterium]|nr:adenosine-specific kinase [Spirochaetales bacterium]